MARGKRDGGEVRVKGIGGLDTGIRHSPSSAALAFVRMDGQTDGLHPTQRALLLLEGGKRCHHGFLGSL